ncbi:MAG: transcriptional repressor, partial [Candidatus Omnitrophota bacterium]|nr:transcriptional repressor [Candidatus Omnitrophota bacterium]
MRRGRHPIATERRKFNHYLEKNGIRTSSGREMVFNVVIQTHGHFTAEEIVKAVKQMENSVSRATVYRRLRELLESGVIRETAFGDKHHHFEHVYDEKPHHHAQCVRCHRFIEFPDLKEDT